MNIPNARERILETAARIFAEKSFEGSRIDEIAREANVPKSLIYYHFKSKDDILRVLTDNFRKEYLDIIDENKNERSQDKAEKLQDRMKTVYYDFGKRNENLIRVMLIDSLKKTKDSPVLFDIVKAMIEKDSEDPEKLMGGKENQDKAEESARPNKVEEVLQKRRIAEFFTSFMPNYAYICFADAWVKYFKMDRAQFDKLYLEVYEETHGAYHRMQENN